MQWARPPVQWLVGLSFKWIVFVHTPVRVEGRLCLKWREVNSYCSFHIDYGHIYLLQSETIQDLLSYLFASTLAKRSYLALLFLSARVLTRPSVEYAKDWPDHFFAFPGLVWSNICWLEKGCSCFVQFCLSLLVWSVCKKGFGMAFGMALITWTQ